MPREEQPAIDSPLQRLARRFRMEWAALAAMLLLLGAFIVWAAFVGHRDLGRQEGDRLQVQARVVDDNLIRQLEGANKALEGVTAGLAPYLQASGIDATSAASELRLLTSVMPGISTMLILDAGGTVVASSRDGLVGRNFRERDYFQAARRGANPATLYVSQPFRSSLGSFVVVVGRALRSSDGAFAGTIAATLDPEYFDVVLRSVLYAPDMRATLIHGDGRVFLSAPPDAQALGVDLARPGSLFTRHRQAAQPASLLVGPTFSSTEDRMVALRSIGRADLQMDRPLVVAVGRDLSAIYQPWRDKAWKSAALFALLVLGSGAVLFGVQRRRLSAGQVEAAVAQERQAGTERVELALRGADLGLWDLHVPSGGLVVNARERTLLGYSPDEPLPSGMDWLRMVHPDDVAGVQAAVQPHLRGEVPAYDCEHRIRHRNGHWVWVYARGMIVERDAEGGPARIVGTHLDIGERKRADEELALAARRLQDSEEQLRQVTDNMPALVSRLDREERFRFVNRTYQDWLGIPPEQLLGRSLREVYGEDTYRLLGPLMQDVLAGGKIVFERELPTPAGPRRVEVSMVPQHGPDGTVQGGYALTLDITARHVAEMQRVRSEERLSLALEGSGLALFDWDIDGDRLFHSAQAAALRGEPAVEVTTNAAGMQVHVHPDDLPVVLERTREALNGSAPLYHAEFRLQTRSGGWVWVRARGRVVERAADGRALRLAGTYADISERKAAEERLRHLAEFDTLTDLPNRALFHDRLHKGLSRTGPGKALALLFLDIDHFKSVNDTLGHEAGDQLLKAFAQRMQQAVRQSDTVARLAGDEFIVILEGLGGTADARMLAGKLVAVLREPVLLAGQERVVTVSVGVALSMPGETDEAALLRRADAALYEAKRRGRDGYHCDGEAG